MAIKVHGAAFSTCTQRILTALTELGVEYELVSINFAAREHKSPAFLKLQPWGKVPVLEDDGFFVFESRAMSKYVAKKYAGQGTKLIPDESDLKGYALFEQVTTCFLKSIRLSGAPL
jgi:glutathione S-transferase